MRVLTSSQRNGGNSKTRFRSAKIDKSSGEPSVKTFAKYNV